MPLAGYVRGKLAALATGHLEAWFKARLTEDLVESLLQCDSPPCCAVHQQYLGSNQPMDHEDMGMSWLAMLICSTE